MTFASNSPMHMRSILDRKWPSLVLAILCQLVLAKCAKLVTKGDSIMPNMRCFLGKLANEVMRNDLLQERRERHRQNYMHVTIHTSQTWADTFISELNDTHVEAELRTKHIPPQVSRQLCWCFCYTGSHHLYSACSGQCCCLGCTGQS